MSLFYRANIRVRPSVMEWVTKSLKNNSDFLEDILDKSKSNLKELQDIQARLEPEQYELSLDDYVKKTTLEEQEYTLHTIKNSLEEIGFPNIEEEFYENELIFKAENMLDQSNIHIALDSKGELSMEMECFEDNTCVPVLNKFISKLQEKGVETKTLQTTTNRKNDGGQLLNKSKKGNKNMSKPNKQKRNKQKTRNLSSQ